MNEDVPLKIFLDQIANPAVVATLTSTASLPDSITPSALVLCLVDALQKAQNIFNAENAETPNAATVATVSARELGPTSVTPDGVMQTQVFYTIGGNLVFNPGNAGPLIL